MQHNLDILDGIKRATGCTILLALKGFAMWRTFPQLRKVLDGVCASSPWEARLGREEFGGEVHVFAAAYSDGDVKELLTLCDEIDFNSVAQWRRFRPQIEEVNCLRRAGGLPNILAGLRINPECSTGRVPMYDPCAAKSRLGIRRAALDEEVLEGISGLHFHTLCEQGADALEITLDAVEKKFGDLLGGMEWINFGGGHWITREGYDCDQLCRLITRTRERYGVRVILEPGEAVALDAGVLVASVLDVVDNDGPIAILDCSCTCHMPDVLEMPYRPEIEGAGEPGEKPHTVRLAGVSCLAGDVIGDYSFDAPIQPGDRIVFKDMAHYTMVKTSFFNGITHPSIILKRGDAVDVVRQFTYADYKNRLC